MSNILAKTLLSDLFEKTTGLKINTIQPLAQSGSSRQYFRIHSNSTTAIGVFNEDRLENEAFIGFTEHFKKQGIRVPNLIAQDVDQNIYLLDDLGDTTLYNYLCSVRKDESFPEELLAYYKMVLKDLPLIQARAGKEINFSLCYPRDSFDKQSMMWDLNYFKYYFIKLAKIPFDEQKLEDDFQHFCDFLLETNCNYFLYRDFQSRNIMLFQNKPWYIDYQGGRKGALQYDVASLLFDAKANIPPEIRNTLLEFYLEEMEKLHIGNREEFLKYFYSYVYIRIFQAMGAYGFRGFYEKKEHFLQSIPFALKNLNWLLIHHPLPGRFTDLTSVLEKIVESEFLKNLGKKSLQLTVTSFSFKRGIPKDKHGNGGGFVFDCRALPNPGRNEGFREMTGKDQPVIDFLHDLPEVVDFFNHVYFIVNQSIRNYNTRKFTNLMVNFGCTGGRHRSVFMAELLARKLRAENQVEVEVIHTEMEELGIFEKQSR